MRNLANKLRVRLSRSVRDEEGSATIPFVIFVPFFMTMVVSSVEMGFVLMRQVMLDRAVDMSVRELRLGFDAPESHDELRERICDRAALIPDCEEIILIELRPISTDTWEPLATGARCIDRAAPPEDMDALKEFVPGAGDNLMLVRVCAKFDPIFPTTGLGLNLPKDNTGAYALIASSAYVNEPDVGG